MLLCYVNVMRSRRRRRRRSQQSGLEMGIKRQKYHSRLGQSCRPTTWPENCKLNVKPDNLPYSSSVCLCVATARRAHHLLNSSGFLNLFELVNWTSQSSWPANRRRQTSTTDKQGDDSRRGGKRENYSIIRCWNINFTEFSSSWLSHLTWCLATNRRYCCWCCCNRRRQKVSRRATCAKVSLRVDALQLAEMHENKHKIESD